MRNEKQTLDYLEKTLKQLEAVYNSVILDEIKMHYAFYVDLSGAIEILKMQIADLKK